MQASALAGASIFPAMVGGLLGVSVYRTLLKFPFVAFVLAVGLGVAAHGIIGSYLVQPIKGVEADLISYGEHLKSFSLGLFSGIIGGIPLAFVFSKKGK
jgi:hypothetical protein